MSVSQLCPTETVSLDTELLDQMCIRLGHAKAESAICAAMEDIAVLLQYTGTLMKAGDVETLAITTSQIEGLALRTGMAKLARVANDVQRLSGRDDVNALAATVSRLRRVGEKSLLAIWNREDVPV